VEMNERERSVLVDELWISHDPSRRSVFPRVGVVTEKMSSSRTFGSAVCLPDCRPAARNSEQHKFSIHHHFRTCDNGTTSLLIHPSMHACLNLSEMNGTHTRKLSSSLGGLIDHLNVFDIQVVKNSKRAPFVGDIFRFRHSLSASRHSLRCVLRPPFTGGVL
jgi:hypothetical protein